MKTSLTKGLDEAKAGEVLQEFAASALFRERVIAVLKEKVATAATASRSKERYTEPSWALYQADSIGYERAIYEVISLLSNKNV
jgi:hypothetical protein